MDGDDNTLAGLGMPAHRVGYLPLLLPTDAPADQVPSLIRRLVAEQLAASGEIPRRVTVVTSSRVRDETQRRWFVEYETEPAARTPEASRATA